MSLRIRLFGAVTVEEHAGPVGTRKARRLLGALALAAGRPVGVDRLAAAVWGEDLPSKPADQLGVLISRLRGVVGTERLRRAGDGYVLDADRVDRHELDRLGRLAESTMAAGDPARAADAARTGLDLSAADLMAGEPGDWLDAEREAVRRTRTRLHLVAARAALLLREPGNAVSDAEHVLAVDPYDEAAVRVLMQAHVAAGRPAAALTVYAELRSRLVDELGVDPARETAELYQAVLAGPAPAPVARPAAARRRPVGRSAELGLLGAELTRTAAGETRTVLLRGEPGIGKTAVLEEFLATADAAVLHGRCDALGRDLPLQPVVDGLDRMLSVAPDALGDDAGLVEPLLGTARSAGPTVPVPADPGEARTRLFAALLRVAQRAAAGRALVVAVDDLHLAGSSTVEWLRFAVRRASGLLVVGAVRAGPSPVPDAALVDLGPVDLTAARELVGARAEEVFERSGGNPLLLLALAAGSSASLRATLDGLLESLGTRAATLQAAAVLGPGIDPELLAAALGVPISAVLDDLDAAAATRLLADRGDRFAHELVRDGVAETASAARRTLLHRRAAVALVGRPRYDPLAAAWHARHGGDVALAAAELVRAARLAVHRHDLDAAERLAVEAAELDPLPDAALIRADIAIRRGDFEAADEHAAHAGPAGFELAGWAAYYQRRHTRALAFAERGVAQADDEAAARCRALAGRISHSLGDLPAAERSLHRATADSAQSGMPRIWLAALRVHTGDPVSGLDLAEVALADPESVGHPFAPGHGNFARWYALGMLGRPLAALSAMDAFARSDLGALGARFEPILLNMRAWILRGLGELERSAELSEAAAERTLFPGLAEPHAHAGLDLAEVALVGGAVDEAACRLAGATLQEAGAGSMVWHQQERHDLLTARIALAQGRAAEAEAAAGAVVDSAAGRGSLRHELQGRIVLSCATGIPDPEAVSQLPACAGLDGWVYTALAGHHLDSAQWRELATRQVGALADRAGEHADALRSLAARVAGILQGSGGR